MKEPQYLPPALRTLVGDVQAILGEVVAVAEGAELYEIIERVRRDMVAFREASSRRGRAGALARGRRRLVALPVKRQLLVARAYTLYLELVNVCENAFRTHRLRERRRAPSEARACMTFVLTAHPTESRSPENIRLLRRVQDLLVESLEAGRPIDRSQLGNLLQLAWRVGTHPPHKPTVEDEAAHLYSLLTDPILDEIVALNASGHRLLLRTWVGGDKDGHPGVGAAQSRASLQLARQRFLEFVETGLMAAVREDAALLGSLPVDRAQAGLEEALAAVRRVRAGDGGRILKLQRSVQRFQSAYRRRLSAEQPQVTSLATLLDVFPALVVPLELREERGRFERGTPIAAMLRTLGRIADGGQVDWYARGCVVSMTSEGSDLIQAQRLVTRMLGRPLIPVIPLFELPEVIARARVILSDAWTDREFRSCARRRGQVEVMLGYSDTAKRMGMLASRVGVHRAMRELGAWAERQDVRMVFFHGSGGSVGRGGGTIDDLAATWPPAALSLYKHTLQGEMIERTLATPEILRSLVHKVASIQTDPPAYRGVGKLAAELAESSERVFAELVGSETFHDLLRDATPYARLQALTIGSRPTRRAGAAEKAGLEKLRAIPWVLCWTQTRLLLHAWLGIGEAWSRLAESRDAVKRLTSARRRDPLLRSYLRLLSFTLAKTEPELWLAYRRALAPRAVRKLARKLDGSYAAAVELACSATSEGTLLPDRPWLEESIHYRAPMIHPLNLLQIELLSKPRWSRAEQSLFRETVTGIASGMLTTG